VHPRALEPGSRHHIWLGRIRVCRKPLGRSRSAVGTPPPRGQERVCTGHGSAGSAGKCLAWPVFFLYGNPSSYRRLFVLLGRVMSNGAAHFDKIALLTTTQHSTPTNRRKPSAAEKGGSGVSPKAPSTSKNTCQRSHRRSHCQLYSAVTQNKCYCTFTAVIPFNNNIFRNLPFRCFYQRQRRSLAVQIKVQIKVKG
jgi:hypothetical protein